ncbi:MAG: transposase [Gemmatimonadales bacterium]|nr:MAG: transposase [Gemmatimonadales bacterium]
MLRIPKVPDVPETERTPLVATLVEIVSLQREEIQSLRDEIARLKGQKPKPQIKPSRLEESTCDKGEGGKENSGKRPGSDKRSKTADLTIHDTQVLKVENVPEGSTFKGYEDFTVQGLIIEAHNVLYRRERWVTAAGETLVAPLPDEMEVLGGHFNRALICFVLYQYHHAGVTQPLILEALREWDIDISAGQVNRIITEGLERFHLEKDEILRVGMEVSGHLNVDDTTARHQGKNGYCTHIGNEWFAWFQSTESKSRINFLTLLRGEHGDYVLCPEAIEYIRGGKMPRALFEQLAALEGRSFATAEEWKAQLDVLNVTKPRLVQLATEGALLGSVLHHGLHPELVIVSDDAGQFNIRLLLHALCWIHAERTLRKLVGYTEEQRAALESIRTEIWDFYRSLKGYREAPSAEQKAVLEARFDAIFTTKTCYATLNQALERLHRNQSELLLVLDRPDIPLHNNLSETDVREYVKKRKISGSTRSDLGRRCRDTFTSLKKTCRKLGVSFWDFLLDRFSPQATIPALSELIRQRATGP